MPEMDGLETVRQLRKIDSRIPIIMFSTLTEHGASATLEALALGATDYVTKPSSRDMAETLEAVSRELIPRIRALCHLPGLTRCPRQSCRRHIQSRGDRPCGRQFKWLRSEFPPAGPMPWPGFCPLCRQISRPDRHCPAYAAHLYRMLAARLAAKSAIPVRECVSGEALEAGCATLAPGDFHMVVSQEDVTRLRVNQEARENFCRPSVDVLFRSVAKVYGGRALAVILTGMGQDGLTGCEALRAAGARIYVQDEASSVVWGMPGFVARSGLADKILPLDQIGAEIVRATTLQAAARSQS